MIVFCHTSFTYAAMLAPGGFQELASSAKLTGLEEDVIVRVQLHLLLMVLQGND